MKNSKSCFAILALQISVWSICLFAVAKDQKQSNVVRFATFNIQELSATKLAGIDASGAGTNPQLKKAAEVIQRIHPDILLINEIDFDIEQRQNAKLFQDRYLAHSQNGQSTIHFPEIYFDEVNTGVQSGRDFDKNGKTGDPEDGFGFGKYPGEYGFAIYSKCPIDRTNVRTFRKFLWKDMPGNLAPDGKEGRPAWYTGEDLAIFRLSSKNHCDVPISVNGKTIHLLCSHPTPPVFDGPEDRNGRRNFDEIRLWADYLTGGQAANYLKDDQGKTGGLDEAAEFVLLGDLNADPTKDKEIPYGTRAIDQLLLHPRVQRTDPTSAGAIEKSTPGAPIFHERWTAHFGRADYVLPSKGLIVKNSAVFWPDSNDPLHTLYAKPQPASDHHPVWVDIELSNGK